jgi:hypothetical protein
MFLSVLVSSAFIDLKRLLLLIIITKTIIKKLIRACKVLATFYEGWGKIGVPFHSF